MINTQLLEYVKMLSLRDTKTLSQKGLKTSEEVGELAKAILPYDTAFATNHRFMKAADILEECVDIMLCTLSIAYDLKFSDEDIEQMMQAKADYWAQLQSAELGLVYPIPYEIHITVKLDNGNTIDNFTDACEAIGVKPLLLDLQNNQGANVMNDVMTSSKHMGTNRSAYDKVSFIVGCLTEMGFTVVREKIETVPWHPAAPKTPEQQMPASCYFEAHLGIPLNDPIHDWDRDRLAAVTEWHNAHLSKSVFKKTIEGKQVVMVTLRSYDKCFDDFEKDLDALIASLVKEGYNYDKPIVEFAVFDTKISHDNSWIKNS